MKENKYKSILIGIIIFAILFRIFFIVKTNIYQLQFDVGISTDYNAKIDYSQLYNNFHEEPNKGRHIDYIMQLYTNWELPTKIIGQFYHPPLHHFIMAITLHIMDIFTENSEIKFESMQVVTCAYSVIMIFALYGILEELEIEDKYKIIAMLFFAFYPLYIFMAGSINNDELVTMLALICLLYLIKWKKNPSMKNTIIIAVSIGLGLMTKSSMYVMVIPAVYVYFSTLIEHVNKDKNVKILLVELLIFCLIASILGFWFQIRGFLNGENTLGIIEPYEYLSIKDKGFWERFGIPGLGKFSEVNVWNNLVYTSLNFGIILKDSIYIKIMAFAAVTLVFDSVYFMCKKFKSEKTLLVSFIAWWFFYFFLNFQMPYSCSMHSRYMIVPISIATIYLAKGLQEEKSKVLKIQTMISMIIVCLMSLGMFIFMI